MIPTGVLGHQVLVRAWVPMDDEHTLFFNMSVSGRTAGGQPSPGPKRWEFTGGEQLPASSDWYGRFRLFSRVDNDYRIDRGVQRRKEDYTGIAGIHTQDIITAVDGRGVASMAALIVALRARHPGDKVSVTYLRDGHPQTVNLTLSKGQPGSRVVLLRGEGEQEVIIDRIETDSAALACRWAAGPGKMATLKVSVNGAKVVETLKGPL